MAREMGEQPSVLGRLAARAPQIQERVRGVLPRTVVGTALLGRGSSDNAALYGRYLFEVASGRPVSLVAPAVHTRLRAEVDYSGYVVVTLSQSGQTPEIVATSRLLRSAGATVVAITNGLDNPLAGECDLALDVDAGPEEAVPSTKAVTAQMAVLVAIAASFGERGPDLLVLDVLPDAVAEVLSQPEPAEELVRIWGAYDKLVVAGRGLSFSAARETALKIREAAQIFAEGSSCADLLHGPIAALGPDTPTLLIGDHGDVSGDLCLLRRRLSTVGVPVATISADHPATVPLPNAIPPVLQPICSVVRGQQLAISWSRERGVDPDIPVGLEKVTLTS